MRGMSRLEPSGPVSLRLSDEMFLILVVVSTILPVVPAFAHDPCIS